MQKQGVSDLVVAQPTITVGACGVVPDDGRRCGARWGGESAHGDGPGSLRKRQRPWYVALPTAARIQCREASFGG